jgi:hypothetical protein
MLTLDPPSGVCDPGFVNGSLCALPIFPRHSTCLRMSRHPDNLATYSLLSQLGTEKAKWHSHALLFSEVGLAVGGHVLCGLRRGYKVAVSVFRLSLVGHILEYAGRPVDKRG